MSIPFSVLGGYLGAGKTTLVNHLLKHAQGERLALIINDFGAINIDAALISEQTDEQINLTNGCICCGMSAGFDEAIEALLQRDPQPDRVIVEASGVADVTALAQYGHHPGLHLDGIIVLADAETVRAKARDKYVDKTVLRQLKGADLIILNKTDLIDDAALGNLETWLRSIAPDAPLIRTSYSRIPVSALFGIGHIEKAIAHGGHEEYTTWQYSGDTPIPHRLIDAFLADLPSGVLRGKGFFSVRNKGDGGPEPDCLLYQQVGQRATLTAHPEPRRTEIVMIGLAVELDLKVLDAVADRHLG